MQSARLALAIESVLEHEGGYREPDDADPNATAFGVTQLSWEWHLAEARKALGRPAAGMPSHVRGITRANAITFYWRYLTGASPWHDVRKIRPLVPMVMLAHCQVMMGHSAGVRVLQRAIGTVEVDGLIGPRTLAELHREAPHNIVRAMEREWRARLNRIIETNPAKEVFRDGWMARTEGWSKGWRP